MPEIICNTSPLQYLHQAGQLSLLQSLAGGVLVPEAVRDELTQGIAAGIDLPDIGRLNWVEIRSIPQSQFVAFPASLGAGETQVLELGLSITDSILILDDAHARETARTLGLKIRGTLGILLDAKQAGLISGVRPIIDHLQSLGFRLSAATRTEVLRLAGELAP